MHVDLEDLRQQKYIVAALATIGVLITTGVVGGLTWLLAWVFGLDIPLLYCLIFGALIAPTDPIAVLALLKQIGATTALELKITGESLFNDGIGVVVFIVLLNIAGLGLHQSSSRTTHQPPTLAKTLHEPGKPMDSAAVRAAQAPHRQASRRHF